MSESKHTPEQLLEAYDACWIEDERTLCEACERGDHANCGMQSWCECDDEGDGDREAAAMPEFDPYDSAEGRSGE